MASKRGKSDNSSLILLAILLAFLAVIDISTLYIWRISTPSVPTVQIDSAKVIEIVNAQTFKIENGNYVRLLGIDAPTQGSNLYDESINALKLMILDKQVKLERDTDNTDSSGKLLRYVYVDYNNQQLFVNKELVRQGYAISFFLEPNTKYRTEIEQARADCLKDKIRLCA